MAPATVSAVPSPSQAPLRRSYARTNRELVEAFKRYLEARGQSPTTIRAYQAAVAALVESLGAASVAEADRGTIRQLLGQLHARGLDANTIRLRTAALRAFFKFIRLSGLSKHDPTANIPHRRIARHVPRVLSVEEIERLVSAARDPFERAVAEVLYATGVRVSELVSLRLEDIDFADGELGSIRVHNGKGGKDRVVLFGRKAAEAIRDYLAWRPSRAGYLFEAPARGGCIIFVPSVRKRPVRKPDGAWYVRCYVRRVQREFKVARASECSTAEEARARFNQIAAGLPGYRPLPARPYTARAVCNVVHRLAERINLGRVHPHALRRAFACHMLSSGADLRSIQELLGHSLVTTTQLYTWLSAGDLNEVHARCHPHA